MTKRKIEKEDKKMEKMTKKDVCLNNEAFAYYSGFGGVEFYHIEYGSEDYIYCVSSAWHGKKRYHKLKMYYDSDYGYVKLHGYKIPLSECIKIRL